MRDLRILPWLILLAGLFCACGESSSKTDGDADSASDGVLEADGDEETAVETDEATEETPEESDAEEAAETEEETTLSLPNDPRDLGPGYADDGFVKETAFFDGLEQGLPSLAVFSLLRKSDGGVLALTEAGPARFDRTSSRWQSVSVEGLPSPPRHAAELLTGVAYSAGTTLVLAKTAGGASSVTAPSEVTSLCAAPTNAATLFVGMEDGSFGSWDGAADSLAILDDAPAVIGESVVRCAIAPDGNTYLWTSPNHVRRGTPPAFSEEIFLPDVSPLARANQAVLFDAEGGIVGTSTGLYRVGEATTATAWEAAVPYPDILSLSWNASTGRHLFGTSYGAWYDRPHERESEQRHVFLSRYWLPDNRVTGVAEDDQGLFFATNQGVARIEETTVRLADIAAEYDRITQERHVREGYTSTENHLDAPGDTTVWHNYDNDNDGQWTEMYLASQALRYAVTGDGEAKSNARVAKDAMLRLERATGISGFFARSTVPASECQAKIDAGNGEWHFSETDSSLCWKGDTSSDEFVGHFYGLPLYYDLVADAGEKEEIAAVVSRVLDHLIERGYCWRDLDGECTTHAIFQPEFINSPIGGQLGDAGMNSVLVLAAFRTGYYMTGDSRYLDAFDFLAEENGYKEWVRNCHDINTRYLINHDTDEMTLMGLLTLIRYEFDPTYLEIWREGLDQEWQSQRPERDPEFAFTAAWGLSLDDPDLADSIETLQRLPRSLIQWGVDNLPRTDIDRNPKDDRADNPQNMTVLPYDERAPMRWAENPYRLIQPGEGRSESSGTYWLLPYWMGRFLGLIRE